MFWAEIWKYQNFLSENFHFLMVKFSVFLNRHVFIMIFYLTSQTTVLHMKSLNQTESPIFVILCVICFQRQSFLAFIFKLLKLNHSLPIYTSHVKKKNVLVVRVSDVLRTDTGTSQTAISECNLGNKTFMKQVKRDFTYRAEIWRNKEGKKWFYLESWDFARKKK